MGAVVTRSTTDPGEHAPEPDVDLARVDTVLATARSVRRRIDFDRPLDPNLLLECIELAVQAPTGAGGEAWRFVVVADERRKRALAAIYREVLDQFAAARGIAIKATQRSLAERLHEMPALILVCVAAPRPGDDVGRQAAYWGSILPAAWSLMLALRSRSIGATWTTLLALRQAEVAQVIGMPPDAVHAVMLPVGHLKQARLTRARRAPASEVTYWDGWGCASPTEV
jgi:nitroreductase